MANYIEKDCTIEFEGKTFKAGGAIVTPNYIVAYPADDGVLKDWHGKALGTWRSVANWPASPNDLWISDRMHQIEATVDGVVYTGRGFGAGMIYKGKRKRQ